MFESNFAALPGFYRLLFLYLEPLSTIAPALIEGRVDYSHPIPSNERRLSTLEVMGW